MEGESLNITNDQIEKLKQLFPETVTEGKIDWEKLQATLGKENIEFSNERYVLNWAGKSEAFKVLQQGITATLKPAPAESVNFETTENVFIEGENLEVLKILQKSYYGKIKCIIIDPPYNTGNDSFIYPDSFKENREDYLKRIGDKDEEGYLLKEGLFRKNSKDSGHYHSNWLSMMYPRLFLARNLLTDDGVIFVHIDDNEIHNLRLIMNEIFGEENFIAVFPWKKRTTKSDVPFGVSQDYEWILSYTKGNFNGGIPFERKYFLTEDFPNDRWRLSDLTTQRTAEERKNSAFDMIDPQTKKVYKFNPNRIWGVTVDTFPEYYKKGKIVFPDDYDFLNISIPAFRVFESEDKLKALKKFGADDAKKSITTFLPKTVGMNEDGNKEIVDLFGSKVFSYPKPVSLTKHLLSLINEPDSIILDFFAGASTTAHAIIELNKESGNRRKFIMVQLPEKCDENSEAFKAGYKTIADISKERIRRVIKKLEKEAEELKRKKAGELPLTESGSDQPVAGRRSPDAGFKVFKLTPSSFKIWRGNDITEENLVTQLDAFTDPVREGSEEENMLYELILKSGYLLTDIVVLKKAQGLEQRAQGSELRAEKGEYYSIKEGELIIALNEINQELVDSIISVKPKKVIMLDNLFTGNDQLKTNTVLQMKDAEIDFKTI